MRPRAVVVEHLIKDYILGDGSHGYTTLREALVRVAGAPLKRLPGSPRAGSTNGLQRSSSFRALDDVSFEVSPGEKVAIVGRNGAGKSTILKVLSRITEPSSGRVAIRGRVASLLEVGTGFHPELTGRENIYLNGSLLGMRRREIDRKFEEIVDFSEIESFLDTPVKRYSSGMYVRLAFAVAAHVEPDILIIDEVLAVGDAAFQRKCLGRIQEASAGHRTVLFVSHNMAAVTRLCPRALLLRSGRVVFDGSATEASRRYLMDGDEQSRRRRDVTHVPRRLEPWGDTMRLTSIELLPRDGRAFKYGEPLRFRIEFTADADRDHVGVGVGIDDLTGSRIATCNSETLGVTVAAKRGVRYAFEAIVPASSLKPGAYGLSCAVLTGDQLYDFLPSPVSFDIDTVDATTGTVFVAGLGSGPIAMASQWTLADPVIERNVEASATRVSA